MDTENEIFRKYMALIQDRFDVVRVSQDFHQESFEQKVIFSYTLLDELNLLPTFGITSLKSTAAAIQLRKQGNEAFRQKRDNEALGFYTRSISVSESDGAEIALAYANRSAVLCERGRYGLSVIDIERALKTGYPQSLRYKLYERKGKCFLKRGNTQEAKRCFMDSLSHLNVAQLGEKQRLSMENSLHQSIRLCEENIEADVGFVDNNPSFVMPNITSCSSVIPNASSKIEIKYSDIMGRHIIARENIKPGEILATEKPFASILLPDYYHTHCTHCYVRYEALIPCSNCSMAMFCDERCQEAALNSYHKIECEIMAYLESLKFNKLDLLALRILIIATEQGRSLKSLMTDDKFGRPFSEKKVFEADEKYISSEYECVHYLEDNIRDRPIPHLFKKSAVAALLLHVLINSSFLDNVEGYDIDEALENLQIKSFVGSLLLKYQHIVLCNAHEISEIVLKISKPNAKISDQILEIGAALYPLLSLLNHSCDPDVTRHSYHDGVVLRSIQPIAAGQQIFDNYGYHYAMQDFHVRQLTLKSQYSFDCKCIACEEKWPLYESVPSQNPRFITNSIDSLTLDTWTKKFQRIYCKLENMELEDQLIEDLVELLMLLHKNVKKPWKLYSECQEVMKQYYAMCANHYKDNEYIVLR